MLITAATFIFSGEGHSQEGDRRDSGIEKAASREGHPREGHRRNRTWIREHGVGHYGHQHETLLRGGCEAEEKRKGKKSNYTTRVGRHNGTTITTAVSTTNRKARAVVTHAAPLHYKLGTMRREDTRG